MPRTKLLKPPGLIHRQAGQQLCASSATLLTQPHQHPMGDPASLIRPLTKSPNEQSLQAGNPAFPAALPGQFRHHGRIGIRHGAQQVILATCRAGKDGQANPGIATPLAGHRRQNWHSPGWFQQTRRLSHLPAQASIATSHQGQKQFLAPRQRGSDLQTRLHHMGILVAQQITERVRLQTVAGSQQPGAQEAGQW